jgi:hypothetical protein
VFKPGTKVKIKSHFSPFYGIAEAPDMIQYRGKILTIEKEDTEWEGFYFMKGISGGNGGKGWVWHESWFDVVNPWNERVERMKSV